MPRRIGSFQKFCSMSREELQVIVAQASGTKDLWHKLGLYGYPTAIYFQVLERKGVDFKGLRQPSKRILTEKRTFQELLSEDSIRRDKKGRGPRQIYSVEDRSRISRETALRTAAKAREELRQYIVENAQFIFCKESIWDGSRVRGIVKKFNSEFDWLEYKCQKCGNCGEWCGESITLELDHADGDNYNNSWENLRYLCPNCHSQTPTYRARNNGKKGERFYRARETKALEIIDQLCSEEKENSGSSDHLESFGITRNSNPRQSLCGTTEYETASRLGKTRRL